MIILGIDPGTTRVGYSLIKKEGSALKHIKSGLISPKEKDNDKRLLFIYEKISKIIKEGKPNLIGLEKIFFSKNQKTAIEVSQSRGVIILCAAKNNIELLELSPTEIKASVTGNGNASKKAVAKMVSLFLKVKTSNLIDDTTDAMAVAITSSNINKKY